ncbi:Exocyst complex component Sec10-like protein [Gracilaria domingensis]|nr:Exocyst complex component Sec10-like protein [Gracilaria domingensis]
MVTRHRPLESSKEPQAFRIRRPSNRESVIYSNSSAPQESSPLTKFNFRKVREHFQEPTSWLERSELTSKNFNAHGFLQRSILQRQDRSASKIPHLPMLDSSVDADAALATLDTVETTLRAHRDESIGEECAARDKLKRALHGSSKKREELSATAHKVRANVVTFGEAGKQAAKSLEEGILSLNMHISSLASLVEARDLVALLTDQASELDAVHVSKLLAKASKILEGKSIGKHLSTDELETAKSEVDACQKELVESIFNWMREAVDSANTVTVRDCALVASELDVYDRFVQEYIRHIVSIDGVASPSESLPANATDLLQLFEETCNGAVSMLRRMMSTIVETFSDPSLPMGILVRLITNMKVIPRASEIFSKTKDIVENGSGETKLKVFETQSNKELDTRLKSSGLSVPSMEFQHNSSPEVPEHDLEVQRQELMAKKNYLVLSADVFKVFARYRSDVRHVCRDLGNAVVESVLAAVEDPHEDFVGQQIRAYLELEKKWIDDQLALTFVDISYMESCLPQLAPTKHTDPRVFHQYTRFYSATVVRFKDITSTAIDFTSEAIARLSDILTVLNHGSLQDVAESNSETPYTAGFTIGCAKADFHASSTSLDTMESRSEPHVGPAHKTVDSETEGSSKSQLSPRGKLTVFVRNVIHEILRCLMVIYVANAETVLQAAAPLLPICKEDAIKEELWAETSSPLTAYAMAVESLSQSNDVMASFLLNLTTPENTTALDSDILIEPEHNMYHLVSQETRDVLHTELTNGLTELGAEAHQGVTAAITAMRLRVLAMLSVPGARARYTSLSEYGCDEVHSSLEEKEGLLGNAKPKPSRAFLEVCNFLEHQIHFIVKNMKGSNRDFVLAEVGALTREAVLKCWCSCPGHIPLTGAMQMIADSRIVLKPFQNHGLSVETVRCLPSLAQLFLETPDGLWVCVECTAFSDVDARILVSLLRKRPDSGSREIIKVCQSLGASEEDLAEET